MLELVSLCYKKPKVKCKATKVQLRRRWLRAICGPPSYDTKNKPTKGEILNFMQEQTEDSVSFISFI